MSLCANQNSTQYLCVHCVPVALDGVRVLQPFACRVCVVAEQMLHCLINSWRLNGI